MTRIDFYILEQDSIAARMLFVCRLVEKAFRQGSKVFIWVDDATTAEALDDLLWSFRPESFIPHAIAGTKEATEVPVVISAEIDLPAHHDLLINRTQEVPPSFSRYQRLAEIAVQHDPILQATRSHYAFYKQRGYPIQTHKLAG